MRAPVVKALNETLRAAVVTLMDEGTPDGRHGVTANDPDPRGIYIVIHPELYATVCEVALGVEFDVNAG